MKECIITHKNVCPHKEISGKLCSPCVIPNHKPMEGKAPYVTVTHGMRGYFAVLRSWYEEDQMWDNTQSGAFSFKTREEAIVDAKEWAIAEEIEYKE